ncbi:unnamed protein product, partial [Ilex paraguariensis]
MGVDFEVSVRAGGKEFFSPPLMSGTLMMGQGPMIGDKAGDQREEKEGRWKEGIEGEEEEQGMAMSASSGRWEAGG